MERQFIETTMQRKVKGTIVFRPIKSWHTNIYAGEKKTAIPGTNDGSGCMRKGRFKESSYEWELCMIPKTVTHRLYWDTKNPNKTISAFLSFPDAMGCSSGEYFWEIYPASNGDIDRFFGDNAEEQMEKEIIKILKKRGNKNGKEKHNIKS